MAIPSLYAFNHLPLPEQLVIVLAKRMPPMTNLNNGGLPGWAWKLLLVVFGLAL
jgi:hypothetical protein